MANPQRENGHIDIANEIIENVFMRGILTKRQAQVVWVILAESWGWVDKRKHKRRKDDGEKREVVKYKITRKPLSLAYIARQTGLRESHVSAIVKELLLMKVVRRHWGYYMFRKDYDTYLLDRGVTDLGGYQSSKEKLLNRYEKVTESVTLTGPKPLGEKAFETLKESKKSKKVSTSYLRDKNGAKNSPYLKSTREKKAADPRVQPTIRYFLEKQRQILGLSPPFVWGQAGKQIKGLGSEYTEETLKQLIDVFFDGADDFTKKAGYPWGLFWKQIGKCLARLNTPRDRRADLAALKKGLNIG